MNGHITRRAFAQASAAAVSSCAISAAAVSASAVSASAVLAATDYARADDSHAKNTETIRVGLIGLDTSHVPAFLQEINGAKAGDACFGAKIVAAFPGGTRDNPASWNRLQQFTEATRKAGVEIVPSIDALIEKVDAVIITSVDGRPHLEQARPVLAARKPLFIDKPVAGTLADAIEIFRLAKEFKTPVFSSSSLRYCAGLVELLHSKSLGKETGCQVHSPCHLEQHHPDLFWYGIHGVETLYTIMGCGCQSVTRVHSPDTDVAVGVWSDGRIGTFRGLRAALLDYGATIFGSKNVVAGSKFDGHAPLTAEVVKFFQTGKPPVAVDETIELYAFMEAADESKRQGGRPVEIATVLAKAKKAHR